MLHWMILAGRITYMTWTSHREQIGSLNEFVTLVPSGKCKGLIIRMITVLIMSIKIVSWIVQVRGKHLTLTASTSTSFFLFILGGVRHETGQRSMIKVGLTSHPGIKRIKPRVHYTLPPTHQNTVEAQLLHWRTVAPLYWFFKWGLIGSDPPDPSTKYLRFKISIRGR